MERADSITVRYLSLAILFANAAPPYCSLLFSSSFRVFATCKERCESPARTSLGSVIGFLAIENAFESTKVPFRRSRPLIETGAADFVFRLLYYGLRHLLQSLTSPHSVNLHLRCALDVVEQVICVGYRLTYRGNAMVGHEEDRFVAEDLGKALAFRRIKSWASVIVVICNHFHHADFRLADLFNVGIFETGERTGKRHMRVEHGFSLRQRLVNWRVNAIAGSLDVTVPTLHLTIVDAYLHERRSLDLRPVHTKRNLVIAVGIARDHLGQVIEDSLVQAMHDCQSMCGCKIDASCHSSALHSWRLMRETWNCMANLLANVVSVSLAAAPRGIRQTRGKTAEPAYQRHRALLRPHAYRPRRGRATEKGTRDVSIDRIAFGPSPARAGLQVTQISRVNSGWRNDFATLSAACIQPAYGATKHDAAFWRLHTPSS